HLAARVAQRHHPPLIENAPHRVRLGIVARVVLLDELGKVSLARGGVRRGDVAGRCLLHGRAPASKGDKKTARGTSTGRRGSHVATYSVAHTPPLASRGPGHVVIAIGRGAQRANHGSYA